MPAAAYRLAEVVGQRALARLLARLVQRGRLPHAVILEGVPGCGRRTLARALAAAHLCHARSGGEACGSCDSCAMVAQGSHPDLTEMPGDNDPVAEDADSGASGNDSIHVDAVREGIAAQAQIGALHGHGRVFLVPAAERMNKDAANALLKVLEEPPAGVLMILTCAAAGGLLPTIRSRAQRYRMHALTKDEVEQVLRRQGVPPSAARSRAALSQGGHRGLDEASAPPLDRLRRLCDGFASAEIGALVAALPARLDAKAEAAGRTLAAEQRRIAAAWLAAFERHLAADLRGPHADRTLVLLDRVAQARLDLGRNLQPRAVFEALALGR